MVKEVFENIFKMEIPLPKNPLKYINSYIVKSKESALIIDTGLKNKICRDAFFEGVKKAGINIDRASFFITHMHADHSGLLGEVSSKHSTIYFSKEDAPFIMGFGNWEHFWENSRAFGIKHGFPVRLSKEAILKHPGYLFSSRQMLEGNIVYPEDGYTIKEGGYEFECIKTPGHTQGHLCLYDKKRGVLFSGDHVLYDITPNISAGYENKNPLAAYLKSLEKVKDLRVNIVLPGHRNTFTDLKRRIEEIKKHHRERLNEVLNILSKKDKNAYETAALMSWDIDCKDFSDYPTAQKWFAHTEAIAHLLYLCETGKVRRYEKNGVYVFSLI